jgi:hypothetical protein
MDESSTTATDNPSEAGASISFDEAPITATETSTQTAETTTDSDNLDTSTSTDTTATADSSPADDVTATDTPASTFDEDLDDWIAKRGLKAETAEEKQSLQDLRNDQREFTRSQQAKKDAQALSDEINAQKTNPEEEEEYDDPAEERIAKIEARLEAENVTRLQSEFYSTVDPTDDEHKAMLEIFNEKMAAATTPEAKQRALEIWGNPSALPDLHDLARARVMKATDNSAALEAAKREERERIAQESNANSTKRGAKATTSGELTPEQQRLKRFSTW